MRKVFIFILLMLGVSPISSQVEDVSNRHFIIAVDGAMPTYTNSLMSNSTKGCVERVLKKLGASESDYITIVSYQIDLRNPNFENFAWVPYGSQTDDSSQIHTNQSSPKTKHNSNYKEQRGKVMVHDEKGKKIIWRKYKENLSDFGNWGNIVAYQHSYHCHISNYKASFQSAAKPYILKATACNKGEVANGSYVDTHSANITYLIMLTDETVNGLDDNYQYEWNNISTSEYANIAHLRDTVFSTLKKINKAYRYESVKVFNKDKIELAHISHSPFVLAVYKVAPVEIPSAQSVTNIPSQLPIKKVRGGYRFGMSLSSNSKYSVRISVRTMFGS